MLRACSYTYMRNPIIFYYLYVCVCVSVYVCVCVCVCASHTLSHLLSEHSLTSRVQFVPVYPSLNVHSYPPNTLSLSSIKNIENEKNKVGMAHCNTSSNNTQSITSSSHILPQSIYLQTTRGSHSGPCLLRFSPSPISTTHYLPYHIVLLLNI